MKKSYVCVLSTNNYFEGVLVLNENLKRIKSKYDLLCLINENISNEVRSILDFFNIKYKEIKGINYKTINDIHPNWRFTFDKLNAFSLCEYDQVVLLDIDIMILKNIDNLFDLDKISSPLDYPWNSDKHSSGIMVIFPNKNDHEKMIDLAMKFDKNNKKIGDQDIINEYFKNISTLPKDYSVTRQILPYTGLCYDYVEDKFIEKNLVHTFIEDSNDFIILHYAGELKPFMLNNNFDDIYSYEYLSYLDIVRKKIKKYYLKNNKIVVINSLIEFEKIKNSIDANYVLFSKNNNINKKTLDYIIEKIEEYSPDFCEVNLKTENNNFVWENQLYLNDNLDVKEVYENGYIKDYLENKVFNISFLKNSDIKNENSFVKDIIEKTNSVLLLNTQI